MTLKNRKETILAFIQKNGETTISEIIENQKISRQALNRYLKDLIKEKAIIKTGNTRGSKYNTLGSSKKTVFKQILTNKNLKEDRIFSEFESKFFDKIKPNLKKNISYVFTEMLNNAIDHSNSKQITVEFFQKKERLGFIISDKGIGIFSKIKKELKYESNLDALNALLKGKLTTAPSIHSGEGIFFSSKVADYFELSSGEIKVVFNNLKKDFALAQNKPIIKGTNVYFEFLYSSKQDLTKIFSEYTDENFQFSKTKVLVKLLEYGTDFISRSEAKRLLDRLDQFKFITLDFTGVDSIGQGFADEVFRVFKLKHPKIHITPIHTNKAVLFMIKRTQVLKRN